MNRSALSIMISLGLLLGACASPAMPSPTAPPPPSATQTSPPTATQPLPTVAPTLTATPTEIPVFWDDFSGEFLPGWSWIRENDALWSLDSEPGFLRIVLTNDRPPRNLLVRDVPYEDFQIVTFVRFKPSSNFQFAGLLVFRDDKNTLALGRAYCDVSSQCVGNGIYFDNVQNGELQGSNFAADTQIKDGAYLRIDKSGTKFTGYYREDGTDWMMIGEHDFPGVDLKVGLITANSPVAGMTAYFDYFTMMELSQNE
jgi:beta-xylosidase